MHSKSYSTYCILLYIIHVSAGEDLVRSVSQIGVSLVQRLSLRVTGGGDLLRQAIAAHIEQCAIAAFPVHGTDIVNLWQAILGG